MRLVTTPAAAAVITFVVVSGAAAAPDSFDGTWSVELATESGLCSPRYSYAVAIRDGRAQHVTGGTGARVSGSVAPNGRVGLTVSNGTASGSGTGQLADGSGSGTWTVPALCSGRWTARRQAERTAQVQ